MVLQGLDKDRQVQATISKAVDTMKDFDSKHATPASLLGKGYEELNVVAANQFSQLGKSPKYDTITFEEFQTVLNNLHVKHSEPQAYKYFVVVSSDISISTDKMLNQKILTVFAIWCAQGDLDRSGEVDLAELQFALYVISLLNPPKVFTPRDVFLLFDLDSKDPKYGEQPGTIDLIEFYEIVRVFNPNITQAQVKSLFDEADTAKRARIDYDEFVGAWVKGVDARDELKKRGIDTRRIDPTNATNSDKLRKVLLDRVFLEDESADAELKEAIQRAFVAKKKVRAKEEGKKRGIKVARIRQAKNARRKQAVEERHRRIEAAEVERKKREEELKAVELQKKAALEKQKREEEEGGVAREAVNRRLEQEKKRREELKLDRMNLASKGLNFLPNSLWTDLKTLEDMTHVVLFDASRNSIKRLPDHLLFLHMTSLQKFDMSNNCLETLPDDIGKMKNLLLVSVRKNQLRSLPNSIGNLTSLRHLDISANKLEFVPESIGFMKDLEVFNAYSNALKNVPDEICDLTKVRSLNLSCSKLEALPKQIGNMKNLQYLDISWNTLRELPKSIGKLSSLTELKASRNKLRNLPDSFNQLSQLRLLDFSFNWIEVLPSNLEGLDNVMKLDLSHNKLRSLPISIGELVATQDLDLSHNKLVKLPSDVARLIEMQVMDVSHNKLEIIPDDFGACSSLRQLNLRNNRLGKDGEPALPKSIASLQQLEWLDCSHNLIQSLVGEFAGLRYLKYLNMSHNLLKIAPSVLGCCMSMEAVNLSQNRITTIPVELGYLSNLKSLDLSCNLIRQLPTIISTMVGLKHLNLYNNRLDRLPVELAPLFHHLETFDVSRNPLRELPKKKVVDSVIGASALALRFSDTDDNKDYEFLKNLRKQTQEHQTAMERLKRYQEIDALHYHRVSLQCEDKRADEWAAKGINQDLLNIQLNKVWEPVENRDEYHMHKSASQFHESSGHKSTSVVSVYTMPQSDGSVFASMPSEFDSVQSGGQAGSIHHGSQEVATVEYSVAKEGTINDHSGLPNTIDEWFARKAVKEKEVSEQNQSSTEFYDESMALAQSVRPVEKWMLPMFEHPQEEKSIYPSKTNWERGQLEHLRHMGIRGSPEVGEKKDKTDADAALSGPTDIGVQITDMEGDMIRNEEVEAKAGTDHESDGTAQERVLKKADTNINLRPAKSSSTGVMGVKHKSESAMNAEGKKITTEKYFRMSVEEETERAIIDRRERERLREEAEQRKLQEQWEEKLDNQALEKSVCLYGLSKRMKESHDNRTRVNKNRTNAHSRLEEMGAAARAKKKRFVSDQYINGNITAPSKYNLKGNYIYDNSHVAPGRSYGKARMKVAGNRTDICVGSWEVGHTVSKFEDREGKPLLVKDLPRVTINRYNLEQYEHFAKPKLEEQADDAAQVTTEKQKSEAGSIQVTPDKNKKKVPPQSKGRFNWKNFDTNYDMLKRKENDMIRHSGAARKDKSFYGEIVGEDSDEESIESNGSQEAEAIEKYESIMKLGTDESDTETEVEVLLLDPEVGKDISEDDLREMLTMRKKFLRKDGLLKDIYRRAWAPVDYDSQDSSVLRLLQQFHDAFARKKREVLGLSKKQFVRYYHEEYALLHKRRETETAERNRVQTAKQDRDKTVASLASRMTDRKDGDTRGTFSAEMLENLGMRKDDKEYLDRTSVKPTKDIWGKEVAQLRAPAGGSIAIPEFRKGLTRQLWEGNPYKAPQRGHGAFKTDTRGGTSSTANTVPNVLSESGKEKMMIAEKVRQRLDEPSQTIPVPSLKKPMTFEEEVKQRTTDHNIRWRGQTRFILQNFSRGYTSGEVAELLRLYNIFWKAAMEEWGASGGAHMDARLTVEDFVTAVRRRVGYDVWTPLYEPVVAAFYKETKTNGGVPPHFDPITPEQEEIRQQRIVKGQQVQREHTDRVLAYVKDVQSRLHPSYRIEALDISALYEAQENFARKRAAQRHQEWLEAIREQSNEAMKRQLKAEVEYYKDKNLQ